MSDTKNKEKVMTAAIQNLADLSKKEIMQMISDLGVNPGNPKDKASAIKKLEYARREAVDPVISVNGKVEEAASTTPAPEQIVAPVVESAQDALASKEIPDDIDEITQAEMDAAAAAALEVAGVSVEAEPAPEKVVKAKKEKAPKPEKVKVERGPHPGFDSKTFVVKFNPGDNADQKSLDDNFERQARTMLLLLVNGGQKEYTGSELRALLEKDRATNFPNSKQKEIVRVFQDYRARYIRAGFIALKEAQ